MSRQWKFQQERATSPKWLLTGLFLLLLLVVIWAFRSYSIEASTQVVLHRARPHWDQQIVAPAADFQEIFKNREMVQGTARVSIEKLADLTEQKLLELSSFSPVKPSFFPMTRTCLIYVTCNAAVFVAEDRTQVRLLLSDFDAVTPSENVSKNHKEIELDELLSIVDKAATKAKCQNKIIVLECGQTVYDPFLGITGSDEGALSNSIEQALKQRPNTWVVCSNAGNQLDRIELSSKQSLFAQSFVQGLMGQADTLKPDGQVNLSELFQYIRARCIQRSGGTLTPVIYSKNSKNPAVVEPESEAQKVFIAVVKDKPKKQAPEKEEQVSSPVQKTEPNKEVGLPKLKSIKFNRLIKFWESIEQEYSSPKWIAIDYAPQEIRRRARKLISVQTKLLNGEDDLDSLEQWELDSHLKSEVQSQSNNYSRELLQRLRMYLRSIYLAVELATLDAQLSAFQLDDEKPLFATRQSLHKEIENLIDSIPSSLDESGKSDSLIVQLDKQISNVQKTLSEFCGQATETKDYGVLRSLLESPALPVQQRASLFALVPDQQDEQAQDLEEDARGLMSLDYAKPERGAKVNNDLAQKLAQRIGPTGCTVQGLLRGDAFREDPSGPNAHVLLRYLDGRAVVEGVESVRSFRFPKPETPKLSLGRRIEIPSPGVSSEVHVSFSGFVGPFELRAVAPASANVKLEWKKQNRSNKDSQIVPGEKPLNVDPGVDTVKLKLTALGYSNAGDNCNLQVVSLNENSPVTASAKLDLPQRKGVSLFVGNSQFDANSVAGGVPTFTISAFPNSSSDAITLSLAHEYPNAKTFELKVYALNTTQLGKESIPGIGFDPQAERGKLLGIWVAKQVATGATSRSTFTRQEPADKNPPSGNSGNPSTPSSKPTTDKTATSDFQSIPGILLELIDKAFLTDNKSEAEIAKQYFVIKFEIRHPSEYVNIDETDWVDAVPSALRLSLRDPFRRNVAGEFYALSDRRIRDAVDINDSSGSADASLSNLPKSSRQAALATAVDIDGFPRVRRWPALTNNDLNFEIEVGKSVDSKEKLQVYRSGDSVLLDAKDKELPWELKLKLRLDFVRKAQDNRVRFAFRNEASQTVFDERIKRIDMRLSEQGPLELTLKAVVEDHLVSIPIKDHEAKQFQIEYGGETKTFEFKFDADEPQLLEISPKAISIVQGDQPPRIVANFLESNVDRLRVRWKKAKDEQWRPSIDAEILGLGRAQFSVPQALLAAEVEQDKTELDMELTLVDQLNRHTTKAYPKLVTIKARPKPVVPPKKKVVPPPPPPPDPPKGDVLILPVLSAGGSNLLNESSLEAKFFYNDKPVAHTKSTNGFVIKVSEAGELKVEFSVLYGGSVKRANESIKIGVQADVKRHETILK